MLVVSLDFEQEVEALLFDDHQVVLFDFEAVEMGNQLVIVVLVQVVQLVPHLLQLVLLNQLVLEERGLQDLGLPLIRLVLHILQDVQVLDVHLLVLLDVRGDRLHLLYQVHVFPIIMHVDVDLFHKGILVPLEDDPLYFGELLFPQLLDGVPLVLSAFGLVPDLALGFLLAGLRLEFGEAVFQMMMMMLVLRGLLLLVLDEFQVHYVLDHRFLRQLSRGSHLFLLVHVHDSLLLPLVLVPVIFKVVLELLALYEGGVLRVRDVYDDDLHLEEFLLQL